jgi:cation:H+ antiporter
MLVSAVAIFLLSAAAVVVAADQLAKHGDIIAVRTNLGGLVVGTIFLAAATSLPELLASVSAFRTGEPDLAAGNFLGSNMVNIFVLALIDLANRNVPLLRRVAITHTLTAVLAIILMLVAIIFIMADLHLAVGWVGLDSLVIIGIYFGGTWLIQQESRPLAGTAQPPAVPVPGEFPSLRRGVVGFSLSTVVLLAVVPQLVASSINIAQLTGIGSGFIGTALLSVVTSLPELMAALAAVRLGAFDLAVGNIFGSSVFNMLAIGLADFFYLDGRFLGDINPNFALVGLLALLLTSMALMANLARIERRLMFIQLDSLAIIVVYLLGLYLLFVRGIGG